MPRRRGLPLRCLPLALSFGCAVDPSDGRRAGAGGKTDDVACAPLVEVEAGDHEFDPAAALGPLTPSACTRHAIEASLSEHAGCDLDSYVLTNDTDAPVRVTAQLAGECDSELGWTLTSLRTADGQVLVQTLDCKPVGAELAPGQTAYLVLDNNFICPADRPYAVDVSFAPIDGAVGECVTAGELDGVALPIRTMRMEGTGGFPTPHGYAGTVRLPRGVPGVDAVTGVVIDSFGGPEPAAIDSVIEEGDELVVAISGEATINDFAVVPVRVIVNDSIRLLGTMVAASAERDDPMRLDAGPESTARQLLHAHQPRIGDALFDDRRGFLAGGDAAIDAAVPALAGLIGDELRAGRGSGVTEWTSDPDHAVFAALEGALADPALAPIVGGPIAPLRLASVFVPGPAAERTVFAVGLGSMRLPADPAARLTTFWPELEPGTRIYYGQEGVGGQAPMSAVVTVGPPPAARPSTPTIGLVAAGDELVLRGTGEPGKLVFFDLGRDVQGLCRLDASGAAELRVPLPEEGVAVVRVRSFDAVTGAVSLEDVAIWSD